MTQRTDDSVDSLKLWVGRQVPYTGVAGSTWAAVSIFEEVCVAIGFRYFRFVCIHKEIKDTVVLQIDPAVLIVNYLRLGNHLP